MNSLVRQRREPLTRFDSNPLAPGNFTEKRLLKLGERLSGQCRAINSELKLTLKQFTGQTLRGLLTLQMAYQLAKFGHAQKVKFKSDTAVLTFTFRFVFPDFSPFLASFFFFAGHLVGFILVGKVLRKVLGSQDQIKGKVGMQWNKIFMEISWSMLEGFCLFLRCP